MRSPAIEFIGFSFQYRAQSEPTLHDIHLTLHQGEKVLIVGPSGSGKSTLGHCINGLAPFFYPGETKGILRIMGEERKNVGIARASEQVGTVLQDPDGQFVGLTVGEDIAFRLENDAEPLDAMRIRVKEAARAVGLEDRLDASPHALSGGQKQRTTLAGVLVSDVDILLFDEPLANLDPAAGKAAIERIDQLHRETGKTVLIIEHRLEEVLHRPVDRIIVMDNGQILADQPASKLLSSSLLAQTGLREPLYLTALKYAGCRIETEMNPQHIQTIDLVTCTGKLQAWHDGWRATQPVPQRPPLLELQELSFSYEKGAPVLHDLSFAIGKGEMLSIVGKNGAGKSTLSRLICGFYRPGGGRILYEGRDMRGDTIKERAERIGFVMQNPNHMISKVGVFEEVALGLKTRGVAEEEIRDRVHAVLRVCGLYEYRNWPISALSFGQKKRVTIAAILVLNPEVIILDEPTAGQDFRHYNEMMEFLRGLNESGITVIMITHDMHLMLEYAERTVVLADGRLLADDHPASLLTREEVVEATGLKTTSVHELARRAGICEPQAFVRHFIEHDREVRRR
ncbi:ABC transporter ATP-binding protein [Gorillibacterium massiliense]|uniref:ABC transporter ATP-binding protein n=1 Tax=Gorillibacterium massiliense TaxID=1280390 RepID=UPI0004ADAF8A|nr:ABC transporter ATP-binding protein [Gorillibacterium massiliense]